MPATETAQRYIPCLERHPDECRIAAVTAPHDADLLGVDDSPTDEVMHAVGQIGLHLAAPLAESCAQQGRGGVGAPIIDLQNRVPSRRERLRPPIEIPVVGRGQPIRRQSQESIDLEAVGSPISNSRHRCKNRQASVGTADSGRVDRAPIDQQVLVPIAGAEHPNQKLVEVVGMGDEFDALARIGLPQSIPARLQGGIEEYQARAQRVLDTVDHPPGRPIANHVVERPPRAVVRHVIIECRRNPSLSIGRSASAASR